VEAVGRPRRHSLTRGSESLPFQEWEDLKPVNYSIELLILELKQLGVPARGGGPVGLAVFLLDHYLLGAAV
jgi:hypothetical protein